MAVLVDSVVVLVELVIVASVISAGVFVDSVIAVAVDGVTVVVSFVIVAAFAVLVVGMDELVAVEVVAADGVRVAVN